MLMYALWRNVTAPGSPQFKSLRTSSVQVLGRHGLGQVRILEVFQPNWIHLLILHNCLYIHLHARGLQH